MNRSYRTRHASGVPGWGPAPGWDQPLPGWNPLIDHGPLPVRMAGPVARWWWPTLAVASFLSVVVYVTSHDPGPSQRGLLTIALAALVVVLLTIHRTVGAGALARATAEYTVVALLAAMLALAGADGQPPATPAAKGEARQAATSNPKVETRDDRPGVIRIAAGAIRAAAKAIRAVTGSARWVTDLWRQTDQQTDRPNRSSSTTTPKAGAMPPSPALAPASTRRST